MAGDDPLTTSMGIFDPLAELGFRDLGFERVSVRRYTENGTPYFTSEPIGMPRIPPATLDLVCYLYDDENNAKAGDEFGGTGFLVGVKSEAFPDQLVYAYAVTNWHIACRGNSVIRLNTIDGGVDVLPYGPDQWHFRPEYDIAIVNVPLVRGRHKYKIMPIEGFITKDGLTKQKIGPGDDVFMVGRFVDHDGGIVNSPAVRFGHISVMPSQIEQPNGRMAEAFCIDIHSRSGYSGSPVFVYRTPGYDLEEPVGQGDQAALLFSGTSLLLLLGIHFAQFPEMWEIKSGSAATQKEAGEPLITEGKYVKGLSGMTCVLPAWTILEVLNSPEMKKQRELADNQLAKTKASSPQAEGFEPTEADGNPNHREDFNHLLVAAVKPPKSSDQT